MSFDATARRLEARFHVQLVPSTTWTDADLRAIESELAALPPKLVLELPGGPLVLERHAAGSAFGMGDGSAERPDWSEGLTRFHLYDVGASDTHDERPMRATARLTDGERVELWRRRAIAHAVIRRWDAQLRWSDSKRFRSIAGWLRPFERPLTFHEEPQLVFDGAFSRARGKQSAALDLATFAEEALVPVDAIHRGAQPVDEAARCQEFSRWRFFFGALKDASLLDEAHASLADRGTCPAFDAWADLESLDHAEVLYVSASGRAPESLFGHLLLRLVRSDPDHVEGPSFGTAIQLVAMTGSDAPDLGYLVRGIAGGYRMGVLTAPMGQIARETLEGEQRSIRRFRLELDADERARLLERTWELERRGYLDYWFFSDNCGTSLAFLLGPVLNDGREVQMPPRLSPVLPSAVLDALSDAKVIVSEPGTFESLRDRALRAEQERDEAGARITAEVASRNGEDAVVGRFRSIDAALHAADLQRRREAWRALEAFTVEVAGNATVLRDALAVYWRASVDVERFIVERAQTKQREVFLRSIDRTAASPMPDAQTLVALRQQEFSREVELDQRLAVLDRVTAAEQFLAHAPRRPLSASEQRTVEEADMLTRAFRELTDAHGRMVDSAFAQQDAWATLVSEETHRRATEAGWSDRALPHSGFARIAIGGGVEAGKAALFIRTGALDERLGDQRLHGFRPSSELRMLAGTLTLHPAWGLPAFGRSDLTIVGYRTLQRELPTLRSSPLDALGWSARLGWDVDPARALDQRTTLQAEALLVLDASADFSRFTAFGVGAHGDALWHDPWARDVAFGVGPQLTLTQRLPLSPGDLADAAFLEIAWRPSLVGTAGWRGVRQELSGSLSADFRLNAGARSFLVSPRVSLGFCPADDSAHLLPEPGVALFVEPL